MASEITDSDKAVPEIETNENVGEGNSPAGGSSDGEGSERTAREKLKKTSIAGLAQYSRSGAGRATDEHPLSESITNDAVHEQPNENGALRGRPSKKRSFEDLQKDDHTGPTENGSIGPPDPKRSHHKRMRSRDVSGDGHQEIGKLEDVGSPVQEESDDETPGGAGVLVDSQTKSDANAQRSLDDKILEEEDTTYEPTVGVRSEPVALPSTSVREPQQPARAEPTEKQSKITENSTLSPASGFTNVSATSPFGSVRSPTSNEPATISTEPATTSGSAFASSGLSAFASSERSPFGASSGTQTSGGFGGAGSGFGGGTSSGFGTGTSSGFGAGSTGFGGTSLFSARGTSGFGSGSGFGSIGGFGGAVVPRPFGGAASSFAGPAGGPVTFGRARPVGARDEEEEEGSEDGGDDEGQQEDDQSKQDNRFHERTVETGEEEEETIFTCRAKLFHFEQKQWKERGVGNLKINVRYEASAAPSEDKDSDEEEDFGGGITAMERRGRVLMRTDGVHRVILNSPVFKGMNVGTKEGEEPTGRTMHLTGLEEGKPKGYQIRIGKEEVAKDFYHKIQELKAEL